PTEFGQLVARYADDIFGIGRELLQATQDPAGSYASVVNIGIADVVPHPLAARLLDRIVQMDSQHARVFMGHPTELLAQLAVHKLDVVISDAPINEPVHHIRAFNHLLGSSPITFLAAPALANALRADFPRSLHQQPLLLPTMNTVVRRALEHWLDVLEIEPHIQTEVENPALLMSLGELGRGAFPCLTVVADQVMNRYHVKSIGRVDNIEARFYAISAERRIRHPAVIALSRTAHEDLFST
ncbi:MAG: LysR substrate-binding domain-containing protein, partial [Myxococcota bacterium]